MVQKGLAGSKKKLVPGLRRLRACLRERKIQEGQKIKKVWAQGAKEDSVSPWKVQSAEVDIEVIEVVSAR